MTSRSLVPIRAALLGLLLCAPLACESPSRPVPGAVATLVGAGDIAGCESSGDELTANILDSVAGTVFTLGDNAYRDGSPEQFAQCYGPTWGRHRSRTRPSPGNHDYNTPGAAGYFAYFGAAAGDPARGYYSYAVGAWHVVVLNTELPPAGMDAQLRWLEEDLAGAAGLCTVVMGHRPRHRETARSVHDAGWGQFLQILRDKAALRIPRPGPGA